MYRHEFYQKPEEVVVTILAKGIPHENVIVDFGEQIVWSILTQTSLLLSFILTLFGYMDLF